MYGVCCTNHDCTLGVPEVRRMMYLPAAIAAVKAAEVPGSIARWIVPSREMRYLHVHQYDEAGTLLASRGCALIPEMECE